MTENDGRALRKSWRGQFYYTAYSAFARGALIWIRPRVPFQLHKVVADRQSPYVLAIARLDGKDTALHTIYAPNTDQHTFLASLAPQLTAALHYPKITVGDFKCVADPQLDRSYPQCQHPEHIN